MAWVIWGPFFSDMIKYARENYTESFALKNLKLLCSVFILTLNVHEFFHNVWPKIESVINF